MLRRTPLKPGGPLPRSPGAGLKRSTLKPVSAKQAAANRVKSKAYKLITPDWCLACGATSGLTPSHILTQKKHSDERANPLNIVWLCAHPCHHTWEHNKARFKLLYPEAFAEKMRRMELIDRQATAFFKMKNPNLFQ